MTFNEYWQALVQRNPGLADDETKMTIKAASFRRSMEQAYEQGRQHRTAGDKLRDSMQRATGFPFGG